ncbi:PREDICTED: uncharacterized protein LOC109186815 [Ipomoea nil]|uniref:uncharacterized protein LOC109186815 n=1 Tax=Ipomoea nil TaxID=35883 RepID=UPI00090193D1|nr:PREDICTED: uncharacterized protein LOC109186815 [Ipomoea nil]
MKTRESKAHNTQKVLNGGSHDHRQESLHIKQDDKFFSRLLSKEKSSSSSIKGESSFRFFYYGDSSKGSIPFRWESQPGTPKHPLSAASLPPLTPPPSYQSSAELKSGSRRSSSSSSRLPSFFSKLSSKKTSFFSNVSSSVSSSSCSSSFSLPSSAPTAALTGRRHRSQSDFQLRLEDLFRDDEASPTSTLCFGGGRGNGGAAAASESGSKSFHVRRSSWLCLNNISVF